MHFLIDGHNLIARMPDIDLADPDDEVKLVVRLKRWASAASKRKVTVIFDAGLPGGKDQGLSNSTVSVLFAPAGVPADTLIIKRIQKMRDVGAHTVVTSDQAILTAARQRKIRTLRSEEFVAVLAEPRPPAQRPAAPDATEDPQLSPNELAEWLALFGPEPETPPAAKKPVPRKKKHRAPSTTDTAEERKRAEELSEWLRLFGYRE